MPRRGRCERRRGGGQVDDEGGVVLDEVAARVGGHGEGVAAGIRGNDSALSCGDGSEAVAAREHPAARSLRGETGREGLGHRERGRRQPRDRDVSRHDVRVATEGVADREADEAKDAVQDMEA